MFKHVLISTDGSDLANVAVKAGVKLAASVSANVTIYRAVGEQFGYAVGEGALLPRSVRERMAREALARVEAEMANAGKIAKDANVACKTVIGRTFKPWQGIISTAKKRHCDVIVMASHGWGGLGSFFIGSVSQKVLAQSTIPVLIYR